jgi:hypothetical protein
MVTAVVAVVAAATTLLPQLQSKTLEMALQLPQAQ